MDSELCGGGGLKYKYSNSLKGSKFCQFRRIFLLYVIDFMISQFYSVKLPARIQPNFSLTRNAEPLHNGQDQSAVQGHYG